MSNWGPATIEDVRDAVCDVCARPLTEDPEDALIGESGMVCSWDCVDDYDDDEYAREQEQVYEYGDDGQIYFADPGGRSALRAVTEDNSRNLPCPNCGEINRLTPKDKVLGYQCDSCADRAEGGGW